VFQWVMDTRGPCSTDSLKLRRSNDRRGVCGADEDRDARGDVASCLSAIRDREGDRDGEEEAAVVFGAR
jgi:hypothetical protein